MFSSINTCWVLVAAFLVYFMQAGFALCEAGLTRAKNTGNILMTVDELYIFKPLLSRSNHGASSIFSRRIKPH